ncbi:hypothetical protein C1I63_01475 [Rathayibacter caricis DSM 15933]|uniref:Uncharacterized protein n=1 Tax=Rathayibacter caricis DSM 15933 TaxID=1328867 RepID=A0A2T4UQ53_9MICO|nr:hypothetical protein [Rathayibacter caricis]PTL71646.1 hypothetical protein C1I63_01475 [Rathayibacter caricis DSM 15933]
MRTRTVPLGLGLLGVLALTGCTEPAPVDTVAPTATTTATRAPAATPTATAAAATPTAESPTGETAAPAAEAPAAEAPAAEAPAAPAAPVAGGLTPCPELLIAAELADLESEGLRLNPEPATYFDYPIVEEMQQAGLLCRWTGQGDVYVVVGQLALSDEQWPTAREGFLSEGFTVDDASAPGFLNGPDVEDESYPGRGVLHSDGVLYYVSYPGILPSVVPLAG